MQGTKKLLNNRYQRLEPPKPVKVDAVAYPRSILGTTDEASLLQNPKMLGHRGLSERQFIHNLAANPCFLARQQTQNPDARRMTDRFRQPRQFFIRFRALQRVEIQLGRVRLGWTADLAVRGLWLYLHRRLTIAWVAWRRQWPFAERRLDLRPFRICSVSLDEAGKNRTRRRGRKR